MSYLRGFVYWFVTGSPFAWLIGRLFSRRVFDRFGPLSTPRNSSPYVVSGLIFGLYEYSERHLVRKWLPVDLPVVELGASIGVVSREILHRLDNRQSLLAFEALPDLADLARTNIRSRYSTTRWNIVAAAIAYDSPEALFLKGPEHVAGKVVRSEDSGIEKLVKVPATTLSSILTEARFAKYSLVMDIEGAEHELIKNDKHALAQCHCIICELHGSQTQKDDFCRALSTLGLVLVERKHSVVAFLRQ